MGTSVPPDAPGGLGRTRQTAAPTLAAGPTASELGLLRPDWGGGRYVLRRVPPPPDLGHAVERFWITEWDLRGLPDHPVELLPHPAVNLVFADGAGTLSGPGTHRFRYPLHGRGRVFGVKLRVGAGFPACGIPMHRLTDQVLPLADVFGPAADALTARLLAAPPDEADDAEQVGLAAGFLRGRLPAPGADPTADLVDGIVHRLLFGDRTLRVEDAARDAGLSMRGMQRLFARYVGVPPKQVLLRYRLHEAADRIAAAPVDDWAAFAAEMGYFDQPHFVRDFTRAVGLSPTAYADRCEADRRAG